MQHVATIVATTAMFLAAADQSDVAPLEAMMRSAREARLETERRNAAPAEVMDAWRDWYAQAIASVARLAGPR
jgi:hypothetical protein